MTTTEVVTLSAEELLEDGLIDEAADAYAQALEADHYDMTALLGLARIALTVGEVRQCIEILEFALTIEPGSPDAWILRGLCDETQSRLDRAISAYGQAVKAAPDSYAARYQLGRVLAAAHRGKDAIAELNKASRLRPQASEPLYALALAYRDCKLQGDALRSLVRAIEVDPMFLDAYGAAADLLCEARRLPEAEKILLQAQSLFPEVAAIPDKLAAVYLKQDRKPEMLEALRAVVQLEPQNEQAHANLATFTLGLGDAVSAAAAIETMIQVHPRSWRARHLRSMLYDLADRPDAAMAELRQAIELAPQEWKPYNDLGMFLNERSKTHPEVAKEAVAALENATCLAPAGEPAPRFNLALAYWNAKRPNEARAAAEDLVRAIPPGHRLEKSARDLLAAFQKVSGTTPEAQRASPTQRAPGHVQPAPAPAVAARGAGIAVPVAGTLRAAPQRRWVGASR